MPARRQAEETARLGDEIYEGQIRPQVEAAHRGEYVAIDVDSGSWVIAADPRTAAEQLRLLPDARHSTPTLWMFGYSVLQGTGQEHTGR